MPIKKKLYINELPKSSPCKVREEEQDPVARRGERRIRCERVEHMPSQSDDSVNSGDAAPSEI
jgi:hypothetical protein